MTNPREIKIKDFDYTLPDVRIAKHPLAQRDRCLLLRADGEGISHHTFGEIPELLPSDTLLVCNNTRVINARIKFRKTTGAEIEVFLLEPAEPTDYNLIFQTREECRWHCLIGNSKRWKEGALTRDIAGGTLSATREGTDVTFRWDSGATFAEVIEQVGFIPIPPYLNRESEETDKVDYQTVYARIQGSVAAPTAGLHFTDGVFEELLKRGIRKQELTLHVGAGTFQPVKSEEIGNHPMHTEVFTVTLDLIRDLIRQKKSGKPIVAVGTTSVRTLESLPYLGAHLDLLYVDQWEPYQGKEIDTLTALENIEKYMVERGENSLTASTSIMIAPGFEWRVVDGMVTNFHQPQSTLLLLVSSFLNRRSIDWRKLYAEALARDYRFLSYGDACLFL